MSQVRILCTMGARLNSGPAPDPNALRRRRPADAASWTSLPPTGLQGDIPSWPDTVDTPTLQEQVAWDDLWRKQPQAHVWKSLHMELQVATYVRTALYAAGKGVRAAYLTQARQQADGLLLTPMALRSARYRIAVDVEGIIDPDLPPAPVLPMRTKRGSGVLGRLEAAVAPEPENDPDDEEIGPTDDDD